MPNWCYNVTTFTFPDKEIREKFISAIKSCYLFATFVPLELGFDSSGKDNWNISTAIEKWGTKWEPDQMEIFDENSLSEKKGDLILHTSFDTAWAPPIGFYESINKNHHIETNSYFYEPGEEVFGYCNFDNSTEVIKYYNYPRNSSQLNILRAEIGINSELDKFMHCEWYRLEQLWDEYDSEDSIEDP
jgi:hypothetical protein